MLSESGLIVFYGKEVIGFLVFNEIPRRLFLGMQGIERDHLVLDV